MFIKEKNANLQHDSSILIDINIVTGTQYPTYLNNYRKASNLHSK